MKAFVNIQCSVNGQVRLFQTTAVLLLKNCLINCSFKLLNDSISYIYISHEGKDGSKKKFNTQGLKMEKEKCILVINNMIKKV